MKREDFIGVDVSLEISLFEYGLLICKNWKCEKPDEWFCLVGIAQDFKGNYNKFTCGYVCESDLLKENWIDWKSVQEFFFIPEKAVFDKIHFVHKLHTLLEIYTYENLGFDSYHPFTFENAEDLEDYMQNMICWKPEIPFQYLVNEIITALNFEGKTVKEYEEAIPHLQAALENIQKIKL